jgi:hypothetical protein
MTLTKTALYRASLLTENLGIRLCLAAVLVMPSALIFLFPLLGLFSDANDSWSAGTPVQAGSWASALMSIVLCIGFAAAWLRIVFPGRLLRRPGLRLFVLAALSVGTATLAGNLTLRLMAPAAQDDAGWLLLAAFVVHAFLLAATLGQAHPDRLNRL